MRYAGLPWHRRTVPTVVCAASLGVSNMVTEVELVTATGRGLSEDPLFPYGTVSLELQALGQTLSGVHGSHFRDSSRSQQL